jgi:hypothetical protein
MAFNNTVPVTLNGTYDSNTNAVTFTIARYDRVSGSTYTQLTQTEAFTIPVPAISYKRDTTNVFIVENESQDEFSITTGWYDVVNDIHYSDVGSELDDFVDALIAQGELVGGGSSAAEDITVADTAGHYVGTDVEAALAEIGDVIRYNPSISENDAKALVVAGTLVPMKWYFIDLSGFSDGDAGDVLAIQALTAEVFNKSALFFDTSEGVYSFRVGTFNGSGWSEKITTNAAGSGLIIKGFTDFFDGYTMIRTGGGDTFMGNVDDSNWLQINETGIWLTRAGVDNSLHMTFADGLDYIKRKINDIWTEVIRAESTSLQLGDIPAAQGGGPFGFDMDVEDKIMNICPDVANAGKIQVDGVDTYSGSYSDGTNTIVVNNGLIMSVTPL